MRVGMVCPFSFDVPGGVQGHVRDLAETLIGLGHEVSVLAPADDETNLPPYAVSAGRAVPVPFNGSVARVQLGPISAARVRRWLSAGAFDVLHVHEPMSPSLALLACLAARGPVVATFHFHFATGGRSKAMIAAQPILQLVLEKITARIAVSALARRAQVEHLGGGAVEIPNGVLVDRYAAAAPLPGWPGADTRGTAATVGFLGRFTEPRKGFDILTEALAALAPARPDLRLLIAGPGDPDELTAMLPAALRDRVTFLGLVSETDKARMLSSVEVYCAPNIGGESFGMILTEAMAAGTPVLASDLDAFRRVLDGGRAGALFGTGDAADLATRLAALLDDPDRRAALRHRAREVVAAYDWPVVARRVVEVYTSAIEATTNVPPVRGDDPVLDERLADLRRAWPDGAARH
jgi:phosphatidyl-myo-inositol alpha-mannosyltransferase